MERSFFFKRARAKVDAVVYDEIRHARDAPGPRRARGHPVAAAAGAPRGRHADERRGAARRADDAAARRPRDDGDVARVGDRAPGAPPRARWTASRRRRTEGGTEYAEAVCKETLRMRPVLPIVARLLKRDVEIGGHAAAGGRDRRAQHLPRPAPRRRLSRARAASGPSASSSGQGGTYSWIPFGGGIRRCIGASFALFEMRIVLQAIARSVELRAAQPQSEPVGRRSITLTPRPRRRGGRRLMARLTRKESQARTRSQLLEAAGQGLRRSRPGARDGRPGRRARRATRRAPSTRTSPARRSSSSRCSTSASPSASSEIDRVLESGASVEDQARQAGQDFTRLPAHRPGVVAPVLRVRRPGDARRGLPPGARGAPPDDPHAHRRGVRVPQGHDRRRAADPRRARSR